MRVAIIGCGQLARMLALSGIPLGIKFSFLVDGDDTTDTRCVDGLGDIVFWNGESPVEDVYAELKEPEVLTFEKEQLTVKTFEPLAAFTQVAPSFFALSICQNRQKEKELLASLDIPSAEYRFAKTRAELNDGVNAIGFPSVVKSVSEGYDGKNQWVLKAEGDASNVPDSILSTGVIVEKWIPFLQEVSLVGVRDHAGNKQFYPLTENVHKNGILIQSIAPANLENSSLNDKAQSYMTKLLDSMDYVGVLAMECFVTDEDILVNELAPRVHNSGHWTQAGALTSQFENHMRAIAGLPLGSTSILGVAGMLNMLGPVEPPRQHLSGDSSLHWYGKTNRPGRKLGHVNFLAESRDTLEQSMRDFSQRLASSSE